MCPNDDAPMQTLQRGGVEFDMCPTCRGVWLDRGELEKLMSLGGEREAAPRPQSRPQSQPHSTPWGETSRPQPRFEEPRRYDHDDRRGGYDKHGKPYKKKGGFDLFDIFD
jgi:hypothetical protein